MPGGAQESRSSSKGGIAAVAGSYARAMRPRHWVKNVLVAAVPLAAGRLFDADVLPPIAIAFVAFCLASSAVYLVNDVCDVAADRAHPTKRLRPIAVGEVSPRGAIVLAIALMLASLSITWLVSPEMTALIGTYLGISAAYSLGLKHQPVIDIAIVASGFVLRAVAGGVAADLEISQWFVMTAAFGSLFIVAGKRFSEVLLVGEGAATSRQSLAGYTVGYLRFVWTLAATITVATYALWAFEMQSGSSRTVLLQLSIVPFLLGLLRYAVDIEHGRAGEPEDIVLGDRALQAIGAAWLVLFMVGIAFD